MSDRIEQIGEEPPFKCASVKRVINDQRQEGGREFDKKKGKKDEKTQDRQPASSTGGNQCGSIIDIEA
ncbi:MAG: hypothetical protein HRF42_12025 [Candidatus Brocadia sp.]|jgi:hypothetical protein